VRGVGESVYAACRRCCSRVQATALVPVNQRPPLGGRQGRGGALEGLPARARLTPVRRDTCAQIRTHMYTYAWAPCRAGELKRVIWEAFKVPAPEGSPVAGQPALDFRSTMLYLCADRDLFMGIKKAFSVATHNIAANVRATAQQVRGRKQACVHACICWGGKHLHARAHARMCCACC